MITDWIVSLVPWWAWLIMAAVVIGAVWRLAGWQGAVGAAIAVLSIMGIGKVRKDTLDAERARQDRDRLRDINARKESDDEIENMGAADLDANLAKYMRDNPER